MEARSLSCVQRAKDFQMFADRSAVSVAVGVFVLEKSGVSEKWKRIAISSAFQRRFLKLVVCPHRG